MLCLSQFKQIDSICFTASFIWEICTFFRRKQYTQSKIDDFMYILKIIPFHYKRRCWYYSPLPTTCNKALREA